MESTEDLTTQIYSILSDISHPIEGTFYLFLIALIFRWRWPSLWNNFLKRIAARVETDWRDQEVHSASKSNLEIRSTKLDQKKNQNKETL